MNKQMKVVQIPNSATVVQMETTLNNLTAKGWRLVQVFALGANTYAVLEKVVTL